MVRDLQFITTVKAKIGPPQAMCNQTQRLAVRRAGRGGAAGGQGVLWAAWGLLPLASCSSQTLCVALPRPPAGVRGAAPDAADEPGALRARSVAVATARLQGGASPQLTHTLLAALSHPFLLKQTMSDIPYSDHFSVDTRWDVAPAGEGACHVSVHLAVPFSKATMWRK